MQSNDLETNGKGEGLGCAPRGLVTGSFWLGEGCRIVPFPRNSSSTAAHPCGCHPPGSSSSQKQTLAPVAVSALWGMALLLKTCGGAAANPFTSIPPKLGISPGLRGPLLFCLSVRRAGGSRGSIQPRALRFSPCLATKTNQPPSEPKCNSKHKRNCKFHPLQSCQGAGFYLEEGNNNVLLNIHINFI